MPSPSPEFNSRKRPLDASESTAKKRESDLNQPEDLSLLFLRWQDYFVMMGDQAHFMEVATSEQGLAEIRTIADSLNELTLLGYDKELILQLLFFNQVLSPLPTEFRQVHHDLVSQGLNHAQIACRFASYPTMPERMAHLTQLKYLLVFFPDKMKNIIINYYTYFISKFNCGSMIALLDTHLGRKKIIEYDLFLKELESISYPVNLIKSLFVLNYRERSPFEVLTYIHQNLKKQKFNRTQVVAFLEWYCSEEESIEQLLMLFQLLPKLGLVLTPDQIINQLREGKWEKKFRNIVRYCSIFREHGFFVANIKALLCLKKGVIKDFIHLLPYLKLKLKRETLMSWVLSVDAKEKMRHLAAFLMTLRQFKYTNECIAKLLVLEHECGDVFGEFVRSYAALEKQGFSQGYVTACFVHCWSMPEGLQRFQKFIEQVPILLHFRSPQEIVQKLEKEDRELTGFKNLIDCYRVLKKYDCRDENAKRFLSQEIQEDILMSIIKWHHLLVKKLDINQLIELTKTESVIEKIKNSISFLDVVSQLGHTEEQIEKFFLFNYENKPFPDEFKRIHGVLIKSGFTLEKLTSYFVLFSTMDERMAYFQELETLFLNLPGFINATILMDTLKTDDGLQKVRYFFSLYKIISELGYEEKQIEIIMFKLSAEERDSLLRLHPHVRLKLNHIEILDLFLLPENRKKWKHLDEFLAEIKGCSYPEECIKPLFLLGYDYDVLSSKEFKELDSGFDINGFKFKDRMACFEYYLKKDDDIFYLKIFVELLPFLLGFFSHSEIMARLIKDNNTIEEFQNIIKFRATLLKLGYVNERQKEMLEANCENKLFPDDFERIHRVLRENRFTLDDILDCFKLFSTMDERAVLFQELERIATNLPDFIRPSFVVEILKTESGLEKLQYISLHYKEKVSRAYTNNEIKILLIKFKKDFFEDLINYYDHLMRVIMDRQQLFFLIDSSVGIEKIRDLIAFVKITSALGYDEDKQRRLLMLNREAKLSADKFKSAHEILFSRGFNHERMMFCFALYKTERENWHHLTELAENVEILFQFFGADKIFNILKTPDGFLKLHFLTACEKNESKKGWIIASLQHIERMALDTQDVNQFAKNLRISFEASLDASSDSANPIPELSDRDRAMTPDNPSSSVYAMLQVLRSSTPPVVSMLLGDEESEHQCALPPDPSQPQATTSSEEDVFQGLEQMGIFFGNRIL